MDRPVPQISLKDQRERTIRTLCEHFAHDHLEVDEFEARLDAAHRARAHDELAALVRDLPALRPRTAPADATRVAPAAGAAERARRAARRAAAPAADAGGEDRTLVAIMSGVERRGHWQPGRRNNVVAIMGGVELDFRELDLPPGETEVSIFCMMGGVMIIVPPHLHVDASGLAIMGGFEHRSPAPRSPDEPVLRVRGFCLMGGVEMQVRRPGESAKAARLRQREERRLEQARRRLGGGTE